MRRSKGEGQIGQRANGRWFAAIQLGGQRRYVYASTRAEVVKKLAQLQQQTRSGHLISASKLTVADFAVDWLDTIKAGRRPTTHSNYQTILRVHVLPVIGRTRLQAIQSLTLVRLYSDLSRAGRSPRTVQLCHRVLHKMLADGVRWQLLPSNPAAGLDAPRVPKRERAVWTEGETAAFVVTCRAYRHVYDPLFIFLLATGCRRGEALGLRWGDVDLEARTAAISRAVTFVQSKPIEVGPKSDAGRRTLVIPEVAIEALRVQRFKVADWQRRHGPAWRDAADRVFVSQTGSTPSSPNLRREFLATCRRAKDPPLWIHGMRHQSATLLVAAGVDVKAAQKRLGHSTVTLTLNTYARAVSSADRAAAEGLDRLLGFPSKVRAARSSDADGRRPARLGRGKTSRPVNFRDLSSPQEPRS